MRLFLVTIAAVCGVESHLLYFIHGEHHFNGIRLLQLALLSPCILCYGLVSARGDSFWSATITTATTWWSFFIALYTSMLIYRAFFHRLRHFPGPYGAKLTKLWHARQSSKFRNYEDIDKLHKQYGQFVRTGPSEVSISDPDAVDMIHGPGSKCSKTIWYDSSYPDHSLMLVRDKAIHDRRRKAAWDRAFNTKALRNYDSRVAGYADELVTEFRAKNGAPIAVEKWFTFYAADTLFDLAFGESSGMLKSGKGHWFYQLIHEGTSHLATFNPIPWFFNIAMRLPFLTRADKNANVWVRNKVRERKEMTMKEADIMSWLLDPIEQPSSDAATNENWLIFDTRTLIVAGTDTTASTLTYAFYRLCQHPEEVVKIRRELDEHKIDGVADFSVPDLQNCKHLNAFIDEVLRLHPAVPSGLVRNTPPEGLQIGHTFIPGDITVATPTYTLHRSPKAFVQPDEFIPERFSTKPELILNKRCFHPFSTGTYSCVGKQLGLMELRTVIAKLLLAFDVSFAEGEDGTALLEKTKDYFILGLAPLKLVFVEREKTK